jgi:glutathione S-transferase
MSDPIILYSNPMSRGRIAHWMLEEVGEPYEMRVLRLDKREHKTPEYLKLNPMGKVPTIVHKGVVVTEAAAICAYLADAFPQKRLAPALDDPARGTYFRWLFFGAGCVEAAIVDKSFSRPMPDRPGVIGYGTYDEVLGALEYAIGRGPFILGEHFTAADVYVASAIGWGMMTKAIEPRPAFQKYMGEMSTRPAFQRMNKQNEDIAAKFKTDH